MAAVASKVFQTVVLRKEESIVNKLIGIIGALGLLVGSGVAVAEDTHAVKVFVGYADTDLPQEHQAPPFVPSPWKGSPDVIFIGAVETTTQAWDAGAIRLDNPSEEPLTVDNVTVDIGPAMGINPWTASFPLVIPGKGTAILTQTGGAFNFDTSDIPTITCTPDGFIPLIHVTVGSTNQGTKNFVDEDQVLNTGGVDRAHCGPPFLNEGQPWSEVHEGMGM
jgi:hypothetical protein